MSQNLYENARRRKNKKSGMKIMLFILLTAVLGAFAILFLLVKINYFANDFSQMMETDYNDLNYMENIGQLLYRHEALVFQHMSSGDLEEENELRDEADEVKKELLDVLSDFENNIKGRENESYYHTIYKGVLGYLNNINMIFELSEQGDVNAARYHMEMVMKDSIKTVNENTNDLKKITRSNMESKKQGMDKTISSTRIIIISVLVVLLLFGTCAILSCGRLASEIVNIDSLTEIPNSDKCEEHMYKLYKKKRLSRYTGILINIKDFNYTNRKYGSVVGDILLNAFAGNLSERLLKDEFISRQAGDSFLLLVNKERAEEFLTEISTVRLSALVGSSNREFKLNTRCGIYPILTDDTVSDVLNCVSMTLNKAKHSVDEDQVWFSKEQYDQINKEKTIIDQFNQGLKNREFVVYYQPKVDISTGRLCGAEALVRWFKDGQMVPPGEFIPVLEKEGKVVDLDFYVFERVCEDLSRWVAQGIQPVRISSNFSKLHLKNKHLAEKIIGITTEYKVDPQYIEVELTESSGYGNLKALKGFIKQMSKANIHTSMDDFGTGYSSLSMLKEVDVDIVKLDKSFLSGVEAGDVVKEKMISNLVHMIQDLDRTVVCEGVETKKEYEFLRSVSCDMIQGYLFDKPLPRNMFEERLMQPDYTVQHEVFTA